MYLLDSDVIIDFFRNDPLIIEKMDDKRKGALYVSSLTLCELFRGAYLSARPQEEEQDILKLLLNTKFASMDQEACMLFGKNDAILSKAGKKTQEVDLMIAGIAISRGLILVTRNKKHFENIPNLKLEEW